MGALSSLLTLHDPGARYCWSWVQDIEIRKRRPQIIQQIQYIVEITPELAEGYLQKSARAFKRGLFGEMAEWLKAHAWKACVRETVPWVRIPLSPPDLIEVKA